MSGSEKTIYTMLELVHLRKFDPDDEIHGMNGDTKTLNETKTMRLEYLRAITTLAELSKQQQIMIDTQQKSIARLIQQVENLNSRLERVESTTIPANIDGLSLNL